MMVVSVCRKIRVKALSYLHRFITWLILCFMISTPVFAWDTQIAKDSPAWTSLYQEQGKSEGHDEHTQLADKALQGIGVAQWFGRGGLADMKLIDLNANHYRFNNNFSFRRLGWADYFTKNTAQTFTSNQ